MLSYIMAGVVALNIIWFNRSSLMEVLNDLSLSDSARHYQTLFTDKKMSTLKCYRWKFFLLLMLSYSLAALLFVYYAFLGFSVIQAYTDENPEGYTKWRERISEIISIYSLFFFASDAILLLSLVWTTQYKIKCLNLFINNLILNGEHPEINDIEIVKNW